tara:strand:- start:269 stop:562 length:294 start_codon:yes stop_codon:yes gene_type:complete
VGNSNSCGACEARGCTVEICGNPDAFAGANAGEVDPTEVGVNPDAFGDATASVGEVEAGETEVGENMIGFGMVNLLVKLLVWCGFGWVWDWVLGLFL